MTNMQAALIDAHQKNLSRYARLLTTDLTRDERDRIHRLISQEHEALESLGASLTEEQIHVPVWAPAQPDHHVS